MFERRERSEEQQELWVMAGEWPPATPDGFYRRVNKTLESIGFASQVWDICEPAYADPSKGGRPGIDPVVSLKMLTVGFFEDLPNSLLKYLPSARSEPQRRRRDMFIEASGQSAKAP